MDSIQWTQNLGSKKGLMGRGSYTCHLNIGNVHKTGQVMARARGVLQIGRSYIRCGGLINRDYCINILTHSQHDPAAAIGKELGTRLDFSPLFLENCVFVRFFAHFRKNAEMCT